MTLRKLASEIAKREGKKSQARIGDIREILKIVATIEAEMSMRGIEEDGPLAGLFDYVDKIKAKLRKQMK